jgi:hypothetical protein
MALAILQLGAVELRTADEFTVRTLFRMMEAAVPRDELTAVVEEPQPEPPAGL